jgi:alpha-L-fucosidase
MNDHKRRYPLNWIIGSSFTLACLCVAGIYTLHGQSTAAPIQPPAAKTYEPTLVSLDTHPLPEWYADAKLGIFIHWGLYSVPGWAPLDHPSHDFKSTDYILFNPYAEWYYNVMRIPGSPTQKYQKEHYGDASYYDFAKTFDRESAKWKPEAWAQIFKEAGARYVVLTTKHHDGFTLWPSSIVNPNQDHLHASRDIVGDLTKAVNQAGLRMGLYYSGGYDWTFNRGPIEKAADYEDVKPESYAYGQYADDQIEELIHRYHPAVLWNDIDWPKSGKPLQVMADYYNTVPDGVVDDRFGVPHADFKSPEYEKLDTISPKKWEECRGLGRSFGYNRAEGEAETIASDELIYLLVDIVSKNGNLLLDVGPEADGTIPGVQMERLHALGAWLNQNGEAIYGTRPWSRATGETDQGIGVRFTVKANTLYASLLGIPRSSTITLRQVSLKPGSRISLLGTLKPLSWSQDGADIKVFLPAELPGKYAYVLRMQE